MPTTTSVHAAIKTQVATTVAAFDFPAKNLPAKADGTVAQAAVLRPSAGLNTHTRSVGTSSGRSDRVVLTCVGATARDALAVADKVHAALNGFRPTATSSPMRQDFASDPVPEPNADPVRISCVVEYSTITKG